LQLSTSFEGPNKEQFLPPCFGEGFEQFRVLVFAPLPQLLLQTLKIDHEEKLPWIGQGKALQLLISIGGPNKEQSLPPCLGSGFEQFLHLSIVPFPQLLLQILKFDHDE